MGQKVLEVKDLNIIYKPYHSMRIRNLFGANNGMLKPIHAIRGISFSIEQGEIVGIVGRNGSGKTTLLRAVAGIFSPDAGTIELFGNRVSLMALGVGFDPELSGRENILLSGIMLGFSRRYITEQMDEIIAFSELAEFIDYPVRTYSSGMYSKLAFSITSFLETDIMLIDEVLSVGDLAFQEKSRKKMRSLISQRKHTVLIVSHNIGLLQDTCDRVIWLDNGKMRSCGEAKQVLREYNSFMLPAETQKETKGISGQEIKQHIWLFGGWENDWNSISEAIPALEGYVEGHLDQWVNKQFQGLNDKTVVIAGRYFTHNSLKLKEMYELKDQQILSLREWLSKMLLDPELEIRPCRARLEASTACQLNCLDCYMRKENSGTAGTGFLTFAHFKQFISENPYIREIELSNSGEVFLNPELVDILRYAWEHKVKITLGNGVNLNTASEEQLEALVKYEVLYMTVSIDGATQEIYSLYRRNGDLKQVFKNIRTISRYKKKYNSSFPQLQWQFIVFEHNRHEKEKARKLAEELGMQFRLKEDWGGYREQEYVPSGKEGEEMPKSAEEAVEISGDCAQMLFSPQVNWDGRLLGCCRVFKEDWGVNVFEEHSLSGAMKNMLYREGLCSHLTRSFTHEQDIPCMHCSEMYKYML